MKKTLASILGILLCTTAIGLHTAWAADATPDNAVIPPITPGLLGWKIEKGNIKVLDESQKGPGGGLVLHFEGETSLVTEIQGYTPTAEKTYNVSFCVRRLSPGDGWAGCVQVLTTDGKTVIQPITYQKRIPPFSEEWTKVNETFKTPPNGVRIQFQIATKQDIIAEVTDLKCTLVPTEESFK